jgi:hypothetical protein
MAVALLTKKDLAKRIGCCERTVRNLLAREDGPVVTRVGGLVRVQEPDFQAFLDRCRESTASAQRRVP